MNLISEKFIEDRLVYLIERLNSAVKVCHEAVEIEDQGYPYATGYSRSAMQSVSEELQNIVKEIQQN